MIVPNPSPSIDSHDVRVPQAGQKARLIAQHFQLLLTFARSPTSRGVFSATFRPRFKSSASQTLPHRPSPRSRITANSPGKGSGGVSSMPSLSVAFIL